MNVVQQFNGLNGATVSREEISKIIALAKKDEQFHIVNELEPLLKYNDKEFIFDIEKPVFEIVPQSLLHCLDCEESQDNGTGLGKAVSPSDIYDMITNKMVELIKNANSKDFVKKWNAKQYGKGYTIPFNFITKKRYRGVNVLMLTELEPLENPFFLTFKQVTELKGQVKKGAKGKEVIYYTPLYSIEDKPKNLKFSSYDKSKVEAFKKENGIKAAISQIPMIKYYNVFNGKDIDGIDFKLDQFKIGYIDAEKPADEENKMPIPEAILKNYPKPQPILRFGGDRAYHQGGGVGLIQMPYLSDFDTVQDYYRTLFHEYAHSTGSPERLNRTLGTKFGSKTYAFEELIAELGATFLSAEAGIIWHTNKNHAAYLKSWNSVLTHIQDDNKFIIKAATEAQKVADFILQFDENGNPLYFKDIVSNVQQKTKEIAKKLAIKKETPVKKEVKPVSNVQKKTKKPVIPKNKFVKHELVKVAYGECKNHIGRVLHCSYDQENDILIYEIENACNKEIPENMLVKSSISKLPSKTSKPVPKKTKQELEAINPKPYAIKPKSASVATAVNDILSLPKYKGSVKPLMANLLFNLFKNTDENEVEIYSDYEIAILKNDSPFHTADQGSHGWLYSIELSDFGRDFVNAVKGRLESLRNQKYNLALFDGLKGTNIVPNIQNTNSLAYKRANKGNVQHEYYTIANKEIANFLGKIEKKQKESVAITIAGGQGSMKTRLCFQLMDAFAQNYKVGHASIEEHPESALYENKVEQYLSNKALHNIEAPEITCIQDVHNLVKNNDVIIIDSFSKLQEMQKGCELDKDFRKAYNGKLFIIIYQLTGDGKMRGGSKSQFDGDVICFVEKMANYKDNYVYADKNRYQDKNLEELKFNIYSGKLQVPEAEKEVLNKHQFSFSVIEK